MAISLEWTEGMSDKEKEEFKELLSRNTIITNRILTLLKKREKLATDKETRETVFDNPNWAYKQAYLNGKVQAIREVMDLFRFLEEKGN